MADRTPKRPTTRQLQDDIQHLTETVEEMLKATADDSRSNIKELREAAEKRLTETRARLEARGEEIYHSARDTVNQQAENYDRYVHDNPWTSIGIGAAAGLVVGLLLGRR